jgi:hypothetical protein
MAHYVAQCITEAETASEADAGAARKRCQDAILALWAHRAELPNGVRPLAALEPLAGVLQAFDPDQRRPFFHRRVWDELTEVRTAEWGARLLIGAMLRNAAEHAADTTRTWVKLALDAQVGNGADIQLILRFSADEGRQLGRRNISILREKYEALTLLAAQAEALAQRYQEEIEAIERDNPPGPEEW